MDDRYGTDVLADGWREPRAPRACRGSRHRATSWSRSRPTASAAPSCGVASGLVELEDRHGRRRLFPLGPGFLVDGADVVLVAAAPTASARRRQRTASGSFAAPDTRARVARASRILVEGRHDAELVEKVWGDDLRAEGVVVEYLQGIDLLEPRSTTSRRRAERRYGVLVDHLVPGSKESRIADAIAARSARPPHARSSGIRTSTSGSA